MASKGRPRYVHMLLTKNVLELRVCFARMTQSNCLQSSLTSDEHINNMSEPYMLSACDDIWSVRLSHPIAIAQYVEDLVRVVSLSYCSSLVEAKLVFAPVIIMILTLLLKS